MSTRIEKGDKRDLLKYRTRYKDQVEKDQQQEVQQYDHGQERTSARSGVSPWKDQAETNMDGNKDRI